MKLLFSVDSAYFNKKIRTTIAYWQKIVDEKHPSIKGNKEEIILTIQSPDEIRQSKKQRYIFLYYKLFDDKYICVVIKFLNSEGFIVTAYHTKRIQEGDLIWKK